MIEKIKALLSGWEIGNKHDYADAYHIYGGSTATHPDILQFLHTKSNCDPTYFIKRNSTGSLLGAYCTWGHRYLAGDTKARKKFALEKYPLTCGEIVLPILSTLKPIIPFKTKYLSAINNNAINATYSFNSNRQIQLAKGCGENGFSSKTKNRRKKELKDFIAAGGEIRHQSSFSNSELINIFLQLFEMRRKFEIQGVDYISSVICELRHHMFGHVLLMRGEPCAFQFITQSESPEWLCFDFINGGFDPRFEKLSVGTIITWLNVNSAYEICQAKEKSMRYSFGNPTFKYKERWCNLSPIGRLLAF